MTEGSELTKCIGYSSGNRLLLIKCWRSGQQHCASSRITLNRGIVQEYMKNVLLTFVGIYLNYIQYPSSGKYRVSSFNSFLRYHPKQKYIGD